MLRFSVYSVNCSFKKIVVCLNFNRIFRFFAHNFQPSYRTAHPFTLISDEFVWAPVCIQNTKTTGYVFNQHQAGISHWLYWKWFVIYELTILLHASLFRVDSEHCEWWTVKKTHRSRAFNCFCEQEFRFCRTGTEQHLP